MDACESWHILNTAVGLKQLNLHIKSYISTFDLKAPPNVWYNIVIFPEKLMSIYGICQSYYTNFQLLEFGIFCDSQIIYKLITLFYLNIKSSIVCCSETYPLDEEFIIITMAWLKQILDHRRSYMTFMRIFVPLFTWIYIELGSFGSTLVKFFEGATPFFTLNWSKYVEFLTSHGGLHPVTGVLWLTNIAHHHLDIAILFLVHTYKCPFIGEGRKGPYKILTT